MYVGTGGLGALAFEQYSLSEMAAYLANNNIIFNAVLVGASAFSGVNSEELRYLCAETGGKVLPLYRPAGIKEIVDDLISAPNGLYFLTYQSLLPTDFGRAWLPVEAEVYLMERSGRDSSGYFPPLE